MSAFIAAWRRTAFAAVALASLSGLSLDRAKAQDAEEMQRAKAALSAALRDRVAAEQKRAEPAPAPAPSPAPAPVQAQPAASTRAAVAQAEPAPASPPRHRPAFRQRAAHRAVASRVAIRRAAAHRTRVARHRSRVKVAAAEQTETANRQAAASAAAAAAADFPATTGSLPIQAAPAASSRPASLALPASLAPTSPTLGSAEPSIYREGVGWIRGTQAALNALQQPLSGARGARADIVAACRDAIIPAAVAGGASEVYAAGTARPQRDRTGTVAPLDVRILYKGVASYEVRQAGVTCELDRTGQVTVLSDATVQPALR